jgi:hypothetical protein
MLNFWSWSHEVTLRKSRTKLGTTQRSTAMLPRVTVLPVALTEKSCITTETKSHRVQNKQLKPLLNSAHTGKHN